MPCGHHRGMKMPPKHPPRDLFHRRLRMTVSLYRTRNLRDAVLSFRLATRCRSPAQGLCPAKREDSYGDKSGPKAGSRASSPGEQAAACDCQRKLVRWAGRARLPKNSCAGLVARDFTEGNLAATARHYVVGLGQRPRVTRRWWRAG